VRETHGRSAVWAMDVLRDALPDLRARVIVADPPWYPDELRSFLWAAVRLAEPSARVLLALPPVGTRPGIEVERRDVLDWAARCGLRAHDVQPGSLGYLCPPFERAALDAQELPGTPDNWRRGDLLTLEVAPTQLPARPMFRDEDWHRVEIDGLPFRVRVQDQPETADPLDARKLLEPIVAGDILPTVSRRAADRRRARVWTSRNRVFASSSGCVMAGVLDALAGDSDVVRAAGNCLGRPLMEREGAAVQAVARGVRQLVARERHEHGLV